MTLQELPCRWCGMKFNLQLDRIEHERCHTDPLPVVRADKNSHPEDGGPQQIAWEERPQSTEAQSDGRVVKEEEHGSRG